MSAPFEWGHVEQKTNNTNPVWLQMLPAEPVTRIMQYVIGFEDIRDLTYLLPTANFFPTIRDGLVSAMGNELVIPAGYPIGLWWLSLFGSDLRNVISHRYHQPWQFFDFQLLSSLSSASITYSEQQLELIRSTNIVDLCISFTGGNSTDSLISTFSNLSLTSLEICAVGDCGFCEIFRQVKSPSDFALSLLQLQTLRISSQPCNYCAEGVWDFIESLPMLSTLQVIHMRVPDNRLELLERIPNISLRNIENFDQVAEHVPANIEEVFVRLPGNGLEDEKRIRSLLQCPKLKTADFLIYPSFPEARAVADVAALMSLKKLKIFFFDNPGDEIKDRIVDVLSRNNFELLSICLLELTKRDIAGILKMQGNSLQDLYLEYDMQLDMVVEILESILKWNHQLTKLGCFSTTTLFRGPPYLTTIISDTETSPAVTGSIGPDGIAFPGYNNKMKKMQAGRAPSPEVKRAMLLLQRVIRAAPALNLKITRF